MCAAPQDVLVSNVWFNLGLFYKANDNREKAVEAFTKARDIRTLKLGGGDKDHSALVEAERQLALLNLPALVCS